MKNQLKKKNSVGIGRNISVLYMGEILSQILTLALIIVISRQLGDEGLGKYSFAFSFASIFLLLADLGMQTYVTKDVARNKKLVKEHLTKTLTLKFFLSIITFIITVAAIFLSKRDVETVLIVFLACTAMFFYGFAGIFRSVVQGVESMQYEVVAKTVERFVAAILGGVLLLNGYGIISLLYALIFSNVVYCLLLGYFTSKNISKLSVSFDFSYWKKIMKKSLPFCLTLIFISLYVRIDTILLGFIKGYAQTGWYSAAYKIIDIFTRMLYVPILALFPAFVRAYKESSGETKMIYHKSIGYMVMLSMPITIGLIVLSGKIILLVYGHQFDNSGIALQILSCSLLFTSLNYLMGFLLNSVGKQKLFMISTGIATVVNVLLNIIVIPKYGYVGASVVTVMSEALNFLLMHRFVKKSGFYIDLSKILVKPAIASLVMSIFLVVLSGHVSLYILIPFGAFIYFTMMVVMKGVGKEEAHFLISLVRQ